MRYNNGPIEKSRSVLIVLYLSTYEGKNTHDPTISNKHSIILSNIHRDLLIPGESQFLQLLLPCSPNGNHNHFLSLNNYKCKIIKFENKKNGFLKSNFQKLPHDFFNSEGISES